jgi:propionyl-CoA synthetase
LYIRHYRKTKGIVRDTGGYAVALKFSMKYIYNVKKLLGSLGYGLGSGHSYILYGPLLNRNTTIIFEGKPIKTHGTFWRIISSIK